MRNETAPIHFLRFRRVFIAVLCAACLILTCFGLTACSKVPTADDAKNYVKATLDIICKGEYDHSVKFSDVKEGEEGKKREEMIDSEISAILKSSESGIEEDTAAILRDAMDKCFANAKYSVKDVAETGKGEYDVVLEIEPLMISADGYEKMVSHLDLGTVNDLNDDVWKKTILKARFQAMADNAESPTYAEPIEVTVHYGKIAEQNNNYGVSAADGQKLGASIMTANEDDWSLPSADYAKKYIKALFDVYVAGSFDSSTPIVDIGASVAPDYRLSVFADFVRSTYSSFGGITNEQIGALTKAYMDSTSRTKYTVDDAERYDSNTYGIPVTVERLELLNGFDEFLEEVDTKIPENYTEEEANHFFIDELIKFMQSNLDNPTFSEPQKEILRYGHEEEGTILCDIFGDSYDTMIDMILPG